MRLAVVGAGAVGGYFGARLTQAGHSVHLLARGEHLERLQQEGLDIESPLGSVRGLEVMATDDPHGIGPVDVVLVAVKAYDLESACNAVQLLVDDDTAVIGVQTGLAAAGELAARLGDHLVMGGFACLEARLVGPGVIRHRGERARLVFGERDGTVSSRGREFERVCREAGIDAQLNQQIGSATWRKWILDCAVAGMTALRRQPLGEVLADDDGAGAYRLLLAEGAGLAAASDVDLADDLVDELVTFSRERLEPGMRSAMLDDLTTGRRLELEALHGHAVRLGRRLGVATPAHEMVYAALKPFRDGS